MSQQPVSNQASPSLSQSHRLKHLKSPPYRCPTLQKLAVSVMQPSASFRHKILPWHYYDGEMVLYYVSWALWRKRSCSFLPVAGGGILVGRSRPSSPDKLCQVHPSVGVRSSSPLQPERIRTLIYRASVSMPMALGLSTEILKLSRRVGILSLRSS